jgi:DNA-binding beta-propeller fold protein YncE
MRIFIAALIALAICLAPVSAQTITKLYVPAGPGSDPGHTATQVYSLETGKVIAGVQPSRDAALAVTNADSTEVWVFGSSSTICDIIDVTTDKIIKTIDVERLVTDAVFTGDGKYCIVVGGMLGGNAGSIVVIDRAAYSVAYSINDVVDPVAVAVSRDSKAFYSASVSENTVTKVEIPSFKVAKRIYAGREPVGLMLSPDGQYLFVVCRGLDSGKRGGSQIAIIDTRTDELFWILDNVGKAPASLALSPDLSRMVVTYATPFAKASENIKAFKLQVSSDSVTLGRPVIFLLGQLPQKGFITGSGLFWIGSDAAAAGVLAIDLSGDTAIATESALGRPRPLQVAAVTINIEQRIAALKAKMETEADSALIPDSYLDMAYLLKTADRKNDMVAAYQRVINDYPKSFAAISAALQLADICFEDQLFGQTAENSFNGLAAYQGFLFEAAPTQFLPQNSLLTAVDRLARFEQQFKKEYVKRIAEDYLKLSVRRPELAEMFFRLGYYLRKQEEKKLAGRCFAEVQNQLTGVDDPQIVQPLSARLALATGDAKALYKIKDRKKAPEIDGQFSEWSKEKPLMLSVISGFEYGPAPWHGTGDLSGSVTMVKTATDLYIAGSITDDSLVGIDDAFGDMMAIYFDMRPNSGSYLTRDFDAGKGCFAFYVMAPTAANPNVRLRLDTQTTFEIAGDKTDSGYAFELRLPLATFGSWLTKDTKKVGLGIEVIDYDSPTDVELVKAIGFLMPSEGFGARPRPELFGVAEF